MRVNRRHPLSRGLSLVWLANEYRPLFVETGVVPVFANVGTADTRPGLAGLAVTGTAVGAYRGGNSASNTYALPRTAGTMLFHVGSTFAPTDSVEHNLFATGTTMYNSGNYFDLNKFSDNKWYFGWASSGDQRASVSATGTFSAGVPFTVGGTWSSAGTTLWVSGVNRATNVSAPTTVTTSGNFWWGTGQSSLGTATWIRSVGDAIYSQAIWSRVLLAEEIQLFERDPYCFLEPDEFLLGKAALNAYTLAVDSASYAVTSPDVGLRVGRKLVVDQASYAVTFPDVGLEYTPVASPLGPPSRPRRKRKTRDEVEGNRDFTNKRNSRPGVAEEEMREVLAAVKAKPALVPVDDDEDDEEAILWLV